MKRGHNGRDGAVHRLTRRQLPLLALTALLPGCGFHPVYARGDNAMSPALAGLAEINVAPMPERSGQIMRLALQSRLERGGTGLARRYDLMATFSISGEAIGIESDSSPSRVRFVGHSNWTLTADDPQRSTVATGTARVVDGYNIIVNQAFAADMESDVVQRRMAEALADQITLQLAAHFSRAAAG